MGKTYIDTVKYQIKSSFEVDGIIEKPDIVGAIFGQTEGLLGDELDLRELQKNGRIGRIEVESQVRGGKSSGTIVVPSSLDMVETSILAAALEIVDRVGPCEAKIIVHRIEDSRNLKRKQVLDRAKLLLKTLMTEEMPESKELSEMVRDDAKISDVVAYGADKLPAGPGIASSNEVLFVEGRADVVNLLKNNIKNAVAIGGANVGKTIIELSKQKEVTVFLDGDRGGDIILRELLNLAEIDYVCRAPTGKEVEELTRKELIKCLRRKTPVEQVEGYEAIMKERAESEKAMAASAGQGAKPFGQQPAMRPRLVPPVPQQPRRDFQEPRREFSEQRREPVVERPIEAPAPQPEPSAIVQDDVPAAEAVPLRHALKALEGSLKARILDKDLTVSAEVPIREIMKAVSDASSIHAIVLDGIVTQRLLDIAESKGATYVVGIRAGNLTRKPEKTKIVLAE